MLNDLIDGALSFIAFIFGIIALMILWVAFSKYIVGIVAGGLFIFFPFYFQHKKNQKERLQEQAKREEAARAAARDPHDRKDITNEATEEDVK